MANNITIRIFALILCCLASFAVSANEQIQPKSNTIGVLLSSTDNPYFVSLADAITTYGAAAGYHSTVLSANNSVPQELAQMKKLVQQKVVAIVYSPTEDEGAYSVIKIANQANIPVVVIDRKVNRGSVLSYISSNNVEGGELAGSFIVEKLGHRANVIQLTGYRNLSTTRERSEGFMSVVNSSGLHLMTSVEADYSATKAKQVIAQLLQTNPMVDAIFAHNDAMALGALEAIEEANADVLVIGYDGTQMGVDAVNDGRLAATIDQQPDLIAKSSIRVIKTWLSGGEAKAYLSVPIKIITQPDDSTP